MNVADWLAAACADADKRGLSELKPMLEALARSTTALRLADASAEAEARTKDAPLADDEG